MKQKTFQTQEANQTHNVSLEVGCLYEVLSVESTRLMELGFVPGQRVKVNGRAPFGGPVLFALDTTVIALRDKEWQCLKLKKILV